MVNRESGILLHLTSLPSKYGIGDLGKHAYEFIDFLQEGSQRLWQILPLNPTGFKDSPYQSFSTFAGNPLLICPEELKRWGLLTESDLEVMPEFPEDHVDYGKVINFKNKLLRIAYENFVKAKTHPLVEPYEAFVHNNKVWLDDYALFMAVKFHFIKERSLPGNTKDYARFARLNKKYLTEEQLADYYYGAVWQSWPEDISKRKASAMTKWRAALAEEIAYYQFLQFIFVKQFTNLKTYANENGVKIIGDIPIFVALDSSDCWANTPLFMLDKHGNPTDVAGVPPDYFSEDGQLWGNPLYEWSEMKRTGYTWWLARIQKVLEFCDVVRIDHFRGFEAYWQIPYGETTAKNGKWIPGPGGELFEVIKKELGDLPIIAEDLGIITPGVEALRDELGLPGMKVIQFGFDAGHHNKNLPQNFETSQSVVYTGTHDNDTTIGWYEQTSAEVQDQFRRYLNVSGEDVAWDMIRLAFLSVAKMAIVPMQDVLRQTKLSRMNTPGTSNGNWQYRIKDEDLKPEIAQQLNYLSLLSDRNIDQEEDTNEALIDDGKTSVG
ncbi:MAG: 4-alpha-glucanotransferase [Turicibacter sp.]|nr:4-alpha-glucanotransferase [Turicibacter sp.]